MVVIFGPSFDSADLRLAFLDFLGSPRGVELTAPRALPCLVLDWLRREKERPKRIRTDRVAPAATVKMGLGLDSSWACVTW